MGVLTNSLVMRVFLKDGVLASPKNILHINLAFANILVVAGFPFSGLSCFHGRYVSLNVTYNVLLFGEADRDFEFNKKVFIAVQNFILNTKRFT